jgi:RNA polymerase sigma factor (sigma-70 family)
VIKSQSMDEVQEFCLRVLSDPALAQDAAMQARREAGGERVVTLAAAARGCRARAEQLDGIEQHDRPDAIEGDGLAAAVARELAQATARLEERQREALALRELLGLSYQQISEVMGIEAAAVAPLLARARLRLRAERRGWAPEQGDECEHRERALRVLATRQDSEPLSAEDDAWLLAHMAECQGCEMAHAAMLEATVCYQAWPRITASPEREAAAQQRRRRQAGSGPG